jgi:hypothetical protein
MTLHRVRSCRMYHLFRLPSFFIYSGISLGYVDGYVPPKPTPCPLLCTIFLIPPDVGELSSWYTDSYSDGGALTRHTYLTSHALTLHVLTHDCMASDACLVSTLLASDV